MGSGFRGQGWLWFEWWVSGICKERFSTASRRNLEGIYEGSIRTLYGTHKNGQASGVPSPPPPLVWSGRGGGGGGGAGVCGNGRCHCMVGWWVLGGRLNAGSKPKAKHTLQILPKPLSTRSLIPFNRKPNTHKLKAKP